MTGYGSAKDEHLARLRRVEGQVRGIAAVTISSALLLAACTGSAGGSPDGEASTPGLPSAHVHGVAIDPSDETLFLATHEGLYRYDESGPRRVGPQIDLMGFTIAGPELFYASGHPGPGVDLAEPVGLIQSTDGGASWTQVSRQGQSDFHALAASSAAIVGSDGTELLSTSDGATWVELDTPVPPYAIATSPDGQVLIATSESGPMRSSDAGSTWTILKEAPLLQVVASAGSSQAVGITPDGTVALSADSGQTWSERGSIPGPPQAVGAYATPAGSLRIVAVTSDGVLESVDRGLTFSAIRTS